MRRKACAFTGHRPRRLPWGYDEGDARCVRLKEEIRTQVQALSQRGFTDFLTGMAEGPDLWFAAAVLQLRAVNTAVKLHCILPCLGQAENYREDGARLYKSILSEADSVIYVNRAAVKSCYLLRNRWMIDRSQLLLAVCRDAARSGAASSVRYARKTGREVILIDPKCV